MLVEGKKVISLYLTDWQMRMVHDFLHNDCHQLTIEIGGGGEGPGGGGGPVLKYMAPHMKELDPASKRMYLTEWQRREIKDETGEACEFLELDHATIARYQGPPVIHVGGTAKLA